MRERSGMAGRKVCTSLWHEAALQQTRHPSWMPLSVLHASIVIARLKKLYAIVKYLVDQSIRPRDTPGPHVAPHVFQVLRLPNPLVRVTHRCLHQVEHAERKLRTRVHPAPEIFPALILYHCIALPFCRHRGRLDYLPVVLLIESELSAELSEILGLRRALSGACEGGKQPGRICRRPKQIGRFIRLANSPAGMSAISSWPRRWMTAASRVSSTSFHISARCSVICW